MFFICLFRKEKMEKMDKTVRFSIILVCSFIMKSFTFLTESRIAIFFSHRKRWTWWYKRWCSHFFSEVEVKIFITYTLIHRGICTKSWLLYDLKHWGPTRKNQTKIAKMSPQQIFIIIIHREVNKMKIQIVSWKIKVE